MTNFEEALRTDIRRRLENDEYRYSDNSPLYVVHGDTSALEKDANYLAALNVPSFETFTQHRRAFIDGIINRYAYLYDLLADANSREELTTRASYEVLGHVFVKFPCYRAGYHKKIQTVRERTRIGELADFPCEEQLDLCDLTGLGYDFTCYIPTDGLFSLAYDAPYTYSHGQTLIAPAKGDVILDCGSGYCDTAFFFAFKTGLTGKVYSFEPNPLMRGIGLRNLQRNGKYARRIVLLGFGVSDAVSENARMVMQSVRSALAGEDAAQGTVAEIRTTTIDHEVSHRRIPKVDFIKMDIEGAELTALRGAAETIRRFRPKLAICVYHKPEDLVEIPRFITSLNAGYAFYLKHHSPVLNETVLYAKAE